MESLTITLSNATNMPLSPSAAGKAAAAPDTSAWDAFVASFSAKAQEAQQTQIPVRNRRMTMGGAPEAMINEFGAVCVVGIKPRASPAGSGAAKAQLSSVPEAPASSMTLGAN